MALELGPSRLSPPQLGVTQGPALSRITFTPPRSALLPCSLTLLQRGASGLLIVHTPRLALRTLWITQASSSHPDTLEPVYF